MYRWYGQLRLVEQAIDDVTEDQRLAVGVQQLQRLDEIEDAANRISIPLSYAEELYGLRSHINFVRKRVQALVNP